MSVFVDGDRCPYYSSFLKDITLFFNHRICGQAEYSHPVGCGCCTGEPLESLTKHSMGWENNTENVFEYPEGVSGKAGEKLQEQRKAVFKSPSDSNYSPRECFPLWLLSDLQLNNSS